MSDTFLKIEDGTNSVRILPPKGEDDNFYAMTKLHRVPMADGTVKNNDPGQENEASHMGKSKRIGQGEAKGQSGKDVINWTAPPPPAPANPGEVIWNSDPGQNRSSSCAVPPCGQSGPSAPPAPPPLLAPEQWN